MKEFDMLQFFVGMYLILSLVVTLLLWTAMAASRMDDMEEEHDSQRLYRIALAISKFKNAGYQKEYDLLEGTASFNIYSSTSHHLL
jgi:hypothetical protein